MTKIKFYGEIAAKFGHEHSLYLDKLSEFGSAMEANFPGFRSFFVRSTEAKKAYNAFVDGKLIKSAIDLQSMLAAAPKEIVLIPVVSGAAFFIPAAAAFVGTAVAGVAGAAIGGAIQAVVSLVLYAVVSAVVTSLFAPKPKGPLQASTANAGLSSYYFSGRENRATQGDPVPIVYGLLKVGSNVIQAGIRNLDKDDFADLNEGISSSIPTSSI